MFFLAIFFWLCKWSILNAFQSEKWCFIISRCFAVSYSWRYIFVYPLYTWHLQVFFLSYVFNNNPHITHRSCEIKAALIVGREVTKGGFVNLCTSFCSFNLLNVSVSLVSIWGQWLAFNELSLSRDNIWILMTRGLNNIWVLITQRLWNTSLVPGKMQSPTHGQVNRSSVFVGNHLEMMSQWKYWAPSSYQLASGRASGHKILLRLSLWNDKNYWETELHKWEWNISKWRCDA